MSFLSCFFACDESDSGLDLTVREDEPSFGGSKQHAPIAQAWTLSSTLLTKSKTPLEFWDFEMVQFWLVKLERDDSAVSPALLDSIYYCSSIVPCRNFH